MENWKDFNETENVIFDTSNIDHSNSDFAGRNVVAHFENTNKRYKIKAKKAFENEIDDEKKNVTINTLITGAFALGTVVCFAMMNNESLEFTRRLGLILGGMTGTGITYHSSTTLADSIKRKLKLEDKYYDTYGEEYEGKKR